MGKKQGVVHGGVLYSQQVGVINPIRDTFPSRPRAQKVCRSLDKPDEMPETLAMEQEGVELTTEEAGLFGGEC